VLRDFLRTAAKNGSSAIWLLWFCPRWPLAITISGATTAGIPAARLAADGAWGIIPVSLLGPALLRRVLHEIY
jgi:hypothetical protein